MLLAEQHAVGQIGQRVVVRHVGDAGFGALALGDVLVGRDPAAVRHRLMRDANRAAVLDLERSLPPAPLEQLLLSYCTLRRRFGCTSRRYAAIAIRSCATSPGLDRIRASRTCSRKRSLQTISRCARVHHAEALRHVVERRTEVPIGGFEVARGPLQTAGERPKRVVRALDVAVVPCEHAHERNAEQDQANHKACEKPMQTDEFVLILRHREYRRSGWPPRRERACRRAGTAS